MGGVRDPADRPSQRTIKVAVTPLAERRQGLEAYRRRYPERLLKKQYKVLSSGDAT